ncbi:hypothetical protein KIW84_075600 [Lathyrus oleraceus]|uniref:Helitron helicase-like domain-containing protein n=1 Tax=Pisum sativum TaxID=3888 RepID=A0A9D4VUE7_PEA|nr:hypothetical protein KIW84_075600 [Pisum sativum]
MCCKGGKVTISQVPAPDELLQLFLDSSTEGRHFRQHIRSYNHVMSFTSLGVHVDENLVATGCGIYTFRAQGAIYHKIGGFHPNQGSRPRYLQLYIYDTDHELQNRMRENSILNQAVVYKLQKLLHQCNPFVIMFRQLALEPNIEECRLLVKEHPSNQPQYSLPSASQVATIVIGGGDEDTIERGRDINVINCDGKLTKVQETMSLHLCPAAKLPLSTLEAPLTGYSVNLQAAVVLAAPSTASCRRPPLLRQPQAAVDPRRSIG